MNYVFESKKNNGVVRIMYAETRKIYKLDDYEKEIVILPTKPTAIFIDNDEDNYLPIWKEQLMFAPTLSFTEYVENK